jgi:hypothetical protein
LIRETIGRRYAEAVLRCNFTEIQREIAAEERVAVDFLDRPRDIDLRERGVVKCSGANFPNVRAPYRRVPHPESLEAVTPEDLKPHVHRRPLLTQEASQQQALILS